MSTAGLVAEGLHCSLGGRVVVRSVSLAVRPGEVVGLLGPNGAGKTTCFRMIAGLVPPGVGRVMLDGRPLEGMPLWQRVRQGLGYLPQTPTGFRGLSVANNLRIPLGVRGAGEAELADLLARVGLTHLAEAWAASLSGGERRRLELARCLAAAPRILLLDEPFAGVDPVAVTELQGQIRSLVTAEGIGVLLTDHAVREAMGICGRVVVLDQGEVIAQGTPEEVAADGRVRARYLGERFHLEGGT